MNNFQVHSCFLTSNSGLQVTYEVFMTQVIAKFIRTFRTHSLTLCRCRSQHVPWRRTVQPEVCVPLWQTKWYRQFRLLMLWRLFHATWRLQVYRWILFWEYEMLQFVVGYILLRDFGFILSHFGFTEIATETVKNLSKYSEEHEMICSNSVNSE